MSAFLLRKNIFTKGKGEQMKAFLILEDGTVFTGTSIGSTRDMISEIVFNTYKWCFMHFYEYQKIIMIRFLSSTAYVYFTSSNCLKSTRNSAVCGIRLFIIVFFATS